MKAQSELSIQSVFFLQAALHLQLFIGPRTVGGEVARKAVALGEVHVFRSTILGALGVSTLDTSEKVHLATGWMRLWRHRSKKIGF